MDKMRAYIPLCLFAIFYIVYRKYTIYFLYTIRHCIKYPVYITSLNPYNNTIKQESTIIYIL